MLGGRLVEKLKDSSTLATTTHLTLIPPTTRAFPGSAASVDVSGQYRQQAWGVEVHSPTNVIINYNDGGSTGKGILIGLLSAFGSAGIAVLVLAVFFFFRYTNRGRILLDRIGRPGEFDDEQAFLKEEAEALERMDELQKAEYLRAKAYVLANPPETAQTEISLSQFLAIQEKGVSAWEFEPELEVANCFVEARTEIEFFDSECTVQSNLPIPKQNEVYYWESKIYDKPDTTQISIGVTTKPYPLFRMPGMHKTSVAYTSSGTRRYNQPFSGTPYGPEYVQGDVIGVGYRPRTGSVFFTRNGKKLDEVVHNLKTQNFFPSIGANGPCTIHVNFGQMGFVFIEANVKKWGLAPMTGSLAPPPPYGSEQGSILLESGHGREAQAQHGHGSFIPSHSRTRSGLARLGLTTGGAAPARSPTEISMASLAHISTEDLPTDHGDIHNQPTEVTPAGQQIIPPPEYTSPEMSPRASSEQATGTSRRKKATSTSAQPPIPTYDAAVGSMSANSSSQ